MFIIFTLLIQLWMIHTVFGNSTLFGTSPREHLTFVKLANDDGYNAEQYYETTRDGYILGTSRIPLHKTCIITKGVIMSRHGLNLSSDDCIIGPGKAHCYICSDNRYDAWAPNSRGSLNSRNHTYDPDKYPYYGVFSVGERAFNDLPVSTDYISNATDPLLTGALSLRDNTKILPRGERVKTTNRLLCGLTEHSCPGCSDFIFTIFGCNRYQITAEVSPVIMKYAPSDTSFRNLKRWEQITNNGCSTTSYDLSNVTTACIDSSNDYVANVTDQLASGNLLVSKLPDETFCSVLSNKSFRHLDLIHGKYIPNYFVTPTVLSTIDTGTYDSV